MDARLWRRYNTICLTAAFSVLVLSIGSSSATDKSHESPSWEESGRQQRMLQEPGRHMPAQIAEMEAGTHFLNLGTPSEVVGWMQMHNFFSNQAMTTKNLDVLFLGDSFVEVLQVSLLQVLRGRSKNVSL